MAAILDTPWSGSSYSPATPLDIATLEEAIVSQLAANISGIEIAHYPDNPESYRLTHRVGAALVKYQGAKYGKPDDTAFVVQKRTLQFEVHIIMRDLGWSFGGGASGSGPGAYSMIEAVRLALTGYQIPGCGKMWPVEERFVERDKQGGVWIYAISVAFTTAAVEPQQSMEYPLFARGIAQERGGLTTVTLAPAPFTFPSSGTIQLPYGNVFAVTVSNPETNSAYARGSDYIVDEPNGIISVINGGAINPGSVVEIAYSYAEMVTAAAAGGSAPTAPSN
jgi:hypothetical protein